MTTRVEEKDLCRQRRDVAAYLDGELDRVTSFHFEQHVKECAVCGAELWQQQSLIRLLDTTFDETHRAEVMRLPKNFAKIIAARADTNISNLLYHRQERGHAIRICVLLCTIAFVLLGAAIVNVTVEAPASVFARSLISGLSVIGHAIRSGSVGVAIILRAVGNRVISEPYSSYGLAILTLFAGAATLLVVSTINYHRAYPEPNGSSRVSLGGTSGSR